MRKNLLPLVQILIFIAVAFPIYAATSNDIKFKHIGIDQGLSHSTINGIAQDNEGFLWVATSDGLNRFDGYSFKVYRPDSLNNQIMDLISDPKGEIWISTQETVYRYSRNEDKFTKVRLDVPAGINKLFNFRDHLFVATSKGICQYNPATDILEITGMLDHRVVDAVHVLNDKIYLGNHDDGVFVIEDEKTSLIPGTEGYNINALLAGKDELFIATEGDGLLLYKPSTGKIKNLSDELGSTFVRALMFDSKNQVWIGTYTGLYILDNTREKLSHYNSSMEDGALSHSSVLGLFNDSQGGIWLGTFFGGLNYYHPIKNQFTNIRKNSTPSSLNDNVIGPITERSNGDLWFGTNSGGVNILRHSDATFSHVTKNDGLGSNDVKAIFLDEKSKRAYIGTNNGPLAILDIDTRKVIEKRENLKNVYDIIPALGSDSLWIASVNGLFLYDPKTGKSLRKISPDKRDRARVLMRSHDNRLWVASEYGMVIFNEKDGYLEEDVRVPPLKTNVSQIFESNFNNDIWIATYSGLYRYRDGENSYIKYGVEDGLPGNIVYAISEDANGNIWVSTNHGLAYMNPGNGIISTFTSKDGIQGNQFNPKSTLMAGNGLMYFGGTNGITFFNPSTFEKNLYSPTPYIGSLKLFNQLVTPGDETNLLKTDINNTKRVTFNSDQTSFTLDFGVNNFTALSHNTFKYKLEGLDKQWTIAPEGVRSVVYSNLPAGKYTFRLMSANNDGIWSDKEKTLEIVILAPWYKRWWANLLFFSIIIIGGFFISRYLLIRRDRKKKEKALRELDEMKLKFFVNMSHELRTPLTLMMLPINDLIERGGDALTMKKYSLIRNNTQRIKNIVDQILEYQKAEMGILKLKVKSTDINSLMHGIIEPYRAFAEKKKIRILFNSDVEQNNLYLDPNYIEHIVTNLLANALKYTPSEGTIIINLHENNNLLTIKISDSGCGIPQEKLQMIFNPFYQVNNLAEGYGIGLALVKRLVETHHGKISVESEPGKGSIFIVTLPDNASSYSQSELAPQNVPISEQPAVIEELIPANETEDEIKPDHCETDGKKTIMIVDDNPEILKYLSESFSHDFNVITAINGAKAIEALATDNIHLVITDVMMPDVDGMQLCRGIKRNLRTSHIPVIMLSGKSEVADKLDGMNVGADDYIDKPFSMKLLLGKVKNILRTRDSIISHYINSKSEIDPVKLTQSPLDEQFLKKAIQVMEDNLDNSEFSTDEFAREMCMSRSNLHLKMKAITGEATNDFIRRTRMTKAADLLKSQNYTVAEVSYMVGYKTSSYFATAFKAFFGYSPSSLLASR